MRLSAVPLDHARPSPPRHRDAALRAIADRAPARDADGAFPAEDIAALAAAGLLTAPLPEALGGVGLGTTPHGALPAATALRAIGRASLPVGRLFEGHLNALRLILRHGDTAAGQRAAAAAAAGALFGVWNTDAAAQPVRIARTESALRLTGRKVLCSGAGHVTHALITATEDGAVRMLVVPLVPGSRADVSSWTAQGMRASATGAVDFTGLELPASALLGAPCAYAAQPDFSAGAWRFAAVQTGGIEALVEALAAQHRATGRGADPHQATRFAEAVLAAEAARLWVEAAATRAEAPDQPDPAATIAHVNLARTAVERAAMDTIALAQRSIGLAALLSPHPAERIARDLATYLRQPAPDKAMLQAASFALAAAHPIGTLWAAS